MNQSRFSRLGLLRWLYCVVALLLCATSASSAQTGRGFVINHTVTQSDIDTLKAWNVNLVRYPLVWADQAASDSSDATSYRAWLLGALTEFDSVLSLLESNGIKVVLNLHTPPGGFFSRDATATHRLFVPASSWTQDAFLESWVLIAARYQGRSGIWGYDLLNEPAQYRTPALPLKDWNTLAQQAAERIRAIDAVTTIIMTPVYGKISRINQMKTLTVSNVIYTIHFYEGWNFVHQGLYGVRKGIVYPNRRDTKAAFAKALRRVIAFRRQNNTEIFVGEFAVIRSAPGAARYLRDVLSLFEKNKFHWTYHIFRDVDVWSLEHGSNLAVTTPSARPTDRLKAVQAVLRKNAPL